MSPFNIIAGFLAFEGRQIYAHQVYFERLENRATLMDESHLIEDMDSSGLQFLDTTTEEGYARTMAHHFRKYGEWVHGFGEISQDIPFNRFILYTFFYIIFLVMLIRIILDPSLNHIPIDEEDRCFWKIFHSVFSLYVLSFLYSDSINVIMNKRAIKAFSHFWRLFDLCTHCLLTISITCNWILYLMEESNDCLNRDYEETLPKKTWEDGETKNVAKYETNPCLKEDTLNQIHMITFAMGRYHASIISYKV